MDGKCIRCGRVIPEGKQLCLHCGSYDDQQRFNLDVLPIVRTNGDLVRQMDNRKLAKLICKLAGIEAWEAAVLEWLESEVPHE